MADIQAAVTGISYLREFTKWVQGLRADADVLTRTNEAQQKVGEVYDKLQELRAENLQLLETNRNLAERLRDADDWSSRRRHYQLVQSSGGAHVLQHDGQDGVAVHHACPACAEKRLLMPLQDVMLKNGIFRCPECKVGYPVERPSHRPNPQVSRGGGSWMSR
ncbi:MAG TPA: hypothetical protein VGH84_02510 [Steroidobacteraceae bacterium]|jgi:hypothetical protein